MSTTNPPLLITGATGTLGQAFQRICHTRGLSTLVLDRASLDISDAASITNVLQQHQPWAVVNAAGYVRVDDAETDYTRCYRENTTGPRLLAEACAAQGIQLLTFSSDLVFDGGKPTPYLENAPARPLNVYGRSKLLAEQAVLSRLPSALVVRTSSFFGPWDEHNFVSQVLTAARNGETFAAADDLFVSPTYVPDLVNFSLDLLIDQATGIWHLTNEGTYTWAELGRLALRIAGLDESCIMAQPAATFGWAARRPRYSVLGSEHGVLLPSVESGLYRFMADGQQVEAANQQPVLVG
jgi:dTDP-4-dehydrorhamnose reductase